CPVRTHQACRSTTTDRAEAAAGVALVLEVIDLDRELVGGLGVRHDLHLRHCRDIIRNGLARGGKPGDCLVSRRKSGEATLCLYDRGRDLQIAMCLAAR